MLLPVLSCCQPYPDKHNRRLDASTLPFLYLQHTLAFPDGCIVYSMKTTNQSFKRLIILSALLLLSGITVVSACELSFKLHGSDGSSQSIRPGSTVPVKLGSSYTLDIEFVEDHRNCHVPPEDTIFLLNDEKWKAAKTDQSLQLTSDVAWVMQSRTLNTAGISFTAKQSGTQVLNIIRECVKGGIDEIFNFKVQ